MTLEQLVVYGGIVVGVWLIGTITFLATSRRHGPALHLDSSHRALNTHYTRVRGSWAGRLRHALGHR